MSGHELATRRPELRRLNERAWLGEAVFQTLAKLDSSLKKNTGFIKKIKSFLTSDGCQAGLREISTLSLEKYLSEVTLSLSECLAKVSKSDDVAASVEIISALHQRFHIQFTPILASLLVNAVVLKDSAEPPTTQRNLLRLLFEMHMVGLVVQFDQCDRDTLNATALKFYSKFQKEPLILLLLKDTLAYNFESGYSLPVAVSFVKRFHLNFQDETPLVSVELQRDLKALFVAFTQKLGYLLQSTHKKVEKLTESNRKQSIRMGRILDESMQQLETEIAMKNMFLTNVEQLYDFLDLAKPELQSGSAAKPEESVTIRAGVEEQKNWWEDTKERDFYKDVPTYQSILETYDIESLDASAYAGLSDGERVVLFLQHLENVVSEDALDGLTAEMHSFVPYKKATRNRMLRFFAEVQKVDIINLYARFLKINETYLAELINDLIELLDKSFRSQIHFGTIHFKNLAFFVELVKFRLIPSHMVFHKLRRMTLDIGESGNVDILSIFYERCGKFLLFEPDYAETTKEMLELLRNQSKSEKLSVLEKLSLSNMFLIVNSFTAPKPKAVSRRVLSPTEDYVAQILKRLVTPSSHTLAVKLLSQINFANVPEAEVALVKTFAKPEDLGADRFEQLAHTLRSLVTDHKENRYLLVTVVDALTEKVVRGLELNDYRQNTSRMAQMKLFAAFYNKKLIGFLSIVDLAFKILCFGYPNNLPYPSQLLPNDPRDNYIRIQLCCALMKTINFDYVKKLGLLNGGMKSAEGFLVFLQYYIFCKKLPLPMDVGFDVEDTFQKFAMFSSSPAPRADDLRAAMVLLQRFNTQSTTAPPQDDGLESEESGSELEVESEASDDEEELVSGDEVEENEASAFESESAAGNESEDLEDDSSLSLDEFYDDEDDEIKLEPSTLSRTGENDPETRRMDETIKKFRDELFVQKKGAPLRIPAPSTFGPQLGQSLKFKVLTKSNNVKEMELPSDNRFSERIQREQAEQHANREKIMSLLGHMDR